MCRGGFEGVPGLHGNRYVRTFKRQIVGRFVSESFEIVEDRVRVWFFVCFGLKIKSAEGALPFYDDQNPHVANLFGVRSCFAKQLLRGFVVGQYLLAVGEAAVKVAAVEYEHCTAFYVISIYHFACNPSLLFEPACRMETDLAQRKERLLEGCFLK